MKLRTIIPKPVASGGFVFTVWAPKANSVQLVANTPQLDVLMEQQEYGYWSVKIPKATVGMRYKYKINNDISYPDPASLSQPGGVHEASEVFDLEDFRWTDSRWGNIPLSDMIQYELHTGTFTPEGTFAGIESRLDYLKDLGINTIELLPVAQFSGKRNWGYDGVYPFAVHQAYGGAKGLMKLVNACHEKGLAVILDVVYNHFGPEGNYIANFGHYFSGKYSTPWGEPLNFDDAHSDEVRNYYIQNALMWCRDFHIDGLRLDAVHAIFDFGANHILKQMADNLNDLSQETGKPYYLIAESHLNDVRFISSFSKGGYGLDAQWSDDFHHAVHVLATNDRKGYYEDFGEPWQLAKAIKDTFVFDGKTYSKYRKKTYGNSTENNGGDQFVIFNQNHDQVGNRMKGERLISLTNFEMAKLIAGVTLVSPNIPMLFMGEEYGERNPFCYFVSHLDPELNRLVNEGRKREFEKFFNDDDKIPDPSSSETFDRAKLSWKIEQDPEKKAMHAFYKQLIKLRKTHPVLRVPDKDRLSISHTGKGFTLLRWQDRQQVLVFMNFSDQEMQLKIPGHLKGNFKKILDSADSQWNGSGSPSPLKVSAADQIQVSKEAILIYSN